MNLEIVWLAYDKKAVERAWREITIRELYTEILQDEFRKRVDPRSMLFHKNQYYLLSDLELLMKRGGNNVSLEEYLARLFHKGVEQFPTDSGELFMDYRIISHFTSLRMADDYHVVEPFFKTLFAETGVLKSGSDDFTLAELTDVSEFFDALAEIRIQDVIDVATKMASGVSPDFYSKLVTNYIEFFHYARNNALEKFFYNSQANIRRWGNLLVRKAERDRRVVELTYSTSPKESVASQDQATLAVDDNLLSKMKFKRRIENLESGLDDPDPLIRQKAAEGLGMTGNYHSVNPLIKALQDDIPEVRQEVVRALGAIRDPRSVDAIIELVLHDDSIAVIMSGAQALVEIGDNRGLDALIELLLRGVYDVAVQIAVFPNLTKNKSAVNMLLQAMENTNEVVRRQIAFILGDVPTKNAVDVLVTSLQDEDAEVKTNSASSLGRIGSKRALPELYEYRNQLEQTQARWVVEEAIDSILEKGRLAS